ncbi:MAG: type VII toxin-antitoxin system HepT family RNase toxin [Thermincolia bacterium]
MTPTQGEIIYDRLRELEANIKILEGLQQHSLAELEKNPVLYWAMERGLHVSIESILDIGNFIISTLKLEKPDSYREIILTLGKEGILPEDFALNISSMVGFRNILVHAYIKVDKKLVYDVMQNKITDFKEFTKYIKTYTEGR